MHFHGEEQRTSGDSVGETYIMIAWIQITVKLQYSGFTIRMRRGEVEELEGVGENFAVW